MLAITNNKISNIVKQEEDISKRAAEIYERETSAERVRHQVATLKKELEDIKQRQDTKVRNPKNHKWPLLTLVHLRK